MSNKKADISQVKKYLAGKLDAPAMHQLERRAQDDPFLMDALEGYEKQGVNQPQLDELTTRLQQRIEKREARIISWRMLSIAASVIAVLTVGGIWVYNNQSQPQSPLMAQADKTEVKSSPLAQAPAIAANRDAIVKNSPPVAVVKTPGNARIMRNRIAANEAPVAVPDTSASMLSAVLDIQEHPIVSDSAKAAAPALDEMLVMNYTNQQKAAKKSLADSSVTALSASRASTAVNAASIQKNDSSALNEVVTVGYGSKRVTTVSKAKPATYIKKQAISPDGKAGVVVLTVKVDANGTLSGIRVVKSLSVLADKKAIQIVKSNTNRADIANNRGKSVTVEIEFRKAD